MELQTIQEMNKSNAILINDKKGSGGAYHSYIICHARDKDRDETRTNIKFQTGAMDTEGFRGGVLDVDLLEICRHRLQSFQKGDFATRENAIALTHIEEALLWLNKSCLLYTSPSPRD